MTVDDTPALPEVKTLPALDRAVAAAAATDLVAETLAPAGADLTERAKLAAAALEVVHQQLTKVRAKRDAAAWTVETCYHARRAASISRALGVGRTRWKAIRDRLALQPPRPVHDAPRVLPKLAAQTVLLEAQERLLIAARDTSLRALKEQTGMTNAAASRLIGRDPARVSHLMKRTP